MHQSNMALLLVLAAACPAKESKMADPIATSSRTELEALGQRLGLVLPQGTEVVHVETESGLDDAIFAKLRIPLLHADEFVQSLHVSHFERGAADLFGPDRHGWDPHRAKGLRVGDVTLPSQRGLVVGVDDGATGALTVYVMNHGT
jgi:hypothetical protein